MVTTVAVVGVLILVHQNRAHQGHVHVAVLGQRVHKAQPVQWARPAPQGLLGLQVQRAPPHLQFMHNFTVKLKRDI